MFTKLNIVLFYTIQLDTSWSIESYSDKIYGLTLDFPMLVLV